MQNMLLLSFEISMGQQAQLSQHRPAGITRAEQSQSSRIK